VTANARIRQGAAAAGASFHGHRTARPAPQRQDRILVNPFDKGNVPAIVRALGEARLNAYAINPTTVSVSVPPISGEQRAEIARHVKRLGEEAKVAIRAIRQEARKKIETTGRGSHRGVQEATDAAVAEMDRLVREKIEEVGR
jgi:ribosome recycling factor